MKIIHKDEWLLAVDKPAGLPTLPTPEGQEETLAAKIAQQFPKQKEIPDCGIVHRLDNDTSGIVLIAKSTEVYQKLRDMWNTDAVKKTYLALLQCAWTGKTVKYVDAPLSKQVLVSGERVVRVDLEGKPAKTRFILVKNYKSCCLMEASPQTGRTHQIRVHSASLGHPIIGDAKYNLHPISLDPHLPQRLYLHAKSISFTHSQQMLTFTAPLDAFFQQALDQLDNI